MEAIAHYFGAIDPDITSRIVADIERAIERLRDFPLSGEAIRGTVLRRVTTRRYRFAISYFPTTGRVEIVGVFRFQNRRI